MSIKFILCENILSTLSCFFTSVRALFFTCVGILYVLSEEMSKSSVRKGRIGSAIHYSWARGRGIRKKFSSKSLLKFSVTERKDERKSRSFHNNDLWAPSIFSRCTLFACTSMRLVVLSQIIILFTETVSLFFFSSKCIYLCNLDEHHFDRDQLPGVLIF